MSCAVVERVVRRPSRAPRASRRPEARPARRGHARARLWRPSASPRSVSRSREVDVGVRVPVRRTRPPPASSTARSRCSIAACRSAPRIRAQPRARCAIGGGGARGVADLLGERERVSCEQFRTLDVSVGELDQREVRQREDARRATGAQPGSVRASSSGARASSPRPARKSACPSGTRPAYRHSLSAGSLSSTNLADRSASAMPRLRYVELTIATTERIDVIPIGERAVVRPVFCDAEPPLDLVATLARSVVRSARALLASSRSRCGLRPGEGVEPAVERGHSAGGEHRDSEHARRARSRGATSRRRSHGRWRCSTSP